MTRKSGLRRELERRLRLLVHECPGSGLSAARLHACEIDDRERDRLRREHDLHRPPVLIREPCPQDLVPADDLGERPLEERLMELSAQAQRDRDVVRRARAHHLVDEPEALLRERAFANASFRDERRQTLLADVVRRLDLARERDHGRLLHEGAQLDVDVELLRRDDPRAGPRGANARRP